MLWFKHVFPKCLCEKFNPGIPVNSIWSWALGDITIVLWCEQDRTPCGLPGSQEAETKADILLATLSWESPHHAKEESDIWHISLTLNFPGFKTVNNESLFFMSDPVSCIPDKLILNYLSSFLFLCFYCWKYLIHS